MGLHRHTVTEDDSMRAPRLIQWSLLCLLACGCGRLETEMASARARFLLAEEPADALGVLDVREAATTGEVVVVGQVGGVPEPWSKGQAVFIIIDPAAGEDDGHLCSDPGCPFCANKKQAENEAIAVVQFVDDRGKVLPLDARELFGLEVQQTVVVRGRANVDELGSLILSANGLYIRR
jgi:hypothetical protein